jgi:spore germination protein
MWRKKHRNQEFVDLSNLDKQPISKDIDENFRVLNQVFANCFDIVFRKINVQGQFKILIVYLNGMVDARAVEQNVLKPLLYQGSPQGLGKIESIAQAFEQELFSFLRADQVSSTDELVSRILKGNVAILVDQENKALIANLTKFDKRAVTEPVSETVLRGPRDGFNESIETNAMLLRRRIVSPSLKMESLKIGELSQTSVVLTYIEELAESSVIEEVKKRLDHIDMKAVVDAGYLEEFIQDSPLSPFPQVLNTERPDVATSYLLEGKVIILTDGSPTALILPVTLWAGMQSPDDYYHRFLYTLIRKSVRYLMAFFALTTPALYIAFTTYNSELVPIDLMTSIAAARETAPFPTFIEVIVMEFIFEGLQEAGIRLPGQLGPIVSIVGALIVGQAAVQAGIISAPIIIVVAMTGIAAYAIPRYNLGTAFRILRYLLIILAGLFGTYGVSIGLIAILIHILTLESVGLPYFAPISPLSVKHLKDTLFRTTRWGKGGRK